MYGVAGPAVSRRLVVCQFTRVYESDGTRNRTGFEVAATKRAKDGKTVRGWARVFARAWRGDKRTGNIRSRHNRFHLLRRHTARLDKNATPTKSFRRNLTSLAARSTRSSSRSYLMAAIPLAPGNPRLAPDPPCHHRTTRFSPLRCFLN